MNVGTVSWLQRTHIEIKNSVKERLEKMEEMEEVE